MEKQKLTEHSLESIKKFLEAGEPDSVDPRSQFSRFDRFEFACQFEEINDDHDMALLVIRSYPELITKVSERLRSSGRFILEATSTPKSKDDEYIYAHSSEQIQKACGDLQDSLHYRLFSAVVDMPSPEEAWNLIRANLEAFAAAQEEKARLELSVAKLNDCAAIGTSSNAKHQESAQQLNIAPKRKFKI